VYELMTCDAAVMCVMLCCHGLYDVVRDVLLHKVYRIANARLCNVLRDVVLCVQY
jgi:hypothetical protein